MRRLEKTARGLYAIGILALFLCSFMILVVIGAKAYRNTVETQQENNRARALLAYLATCVKNHDEQSAISIYQTADTKALILADGLSGYALRIYHMDGRLLEDYAFIEDPFLPEYAQVIGETDIWTIEPYPGGVIAVTTDLGRILLHVRSHTIQEVVSEKNG